MQRLYALFKEHVYTRQENAEKLLKVLKGDALLIHSGTSSLYFADDQEIPFRTTPHFASWLPLQGFGHILLIRRGVKPLLFITTPDDFWYEHAREVNPFWKEYFECREVATEAEAWGEALEILSGARVFYVGSPESFSSQNIDRELINQRSVIAHLDWGRSFKTEYEIACITEANRISAEGHLAARDAFLNGGDELQIHQHYMQAIRATEKELPYETIVALNEKGATLHYQGKRTGVEGRSLLIDAGAQYLGYCSDITRTYVKEDADPLFKELVAGVDTLQLELVARITIGLSFAELHRTAEVQIANLLQKLDILKVDGEHATQEALTKPFFPHGVGHMLGIQVHDVGGKQINEAGDMLETPASQNLRAARVIEERQVFTLEPGIYFIPMLLSKYRTGEHAEKFNWQLIDRLMPFGGVRVEDDIAILKDGVKNLTRAYLPL